MLLKKMKVIFLHIFWVLKFSLIYLKCFFILFIENELYVEMSYDKNTYSPYMCKQRQWMQNTWN